MRKIPPEKFLPGKFWKGRRVSGRNIFYAICGSSTFCTNRPRHIITHGLPTLPSPRFIRGLAFLRFHPHNPITLNPFSYPKTYHSWFEKGSSVSLNISDGLDCVTGRGVDQKRSWSDWGGSGDVIEQSDWSARGSSHHGRECWWDSDEAFGWKFGECVGSHSWSCNPEEYSGN